jgi:rfaE bifunctional protein nucleotidyltransferase chain/domain
MKNKNSIFRDYFALSRLLRMQARKGRKIVFTNGCFDILHKGHAAYLEKARKLGDILVVGLNSDSSVKKIKTGGRPIVKEDDRAYVLSRLKSVDYVCLFKETTPLELIRAVQPDVLVKGGDYRAGNIVGADIVRSRGGKVVTIPFVKGYSTSRLIQKIKNLSRKTRHAE